jgi:hypothetical protein
LAGTTHAISKIGFALEDRVDKLSAAKAFMTIKDAAHMGREAICLEPRRRE